MKENPNKRISINDATKDELIDAIHSELTYGSYIDRMEKHIYFIRCARLIEEMQDACNEMSRNCQGDGFDPKKRERWVVASKRWESLNNKLTELQER